MKYTTLLFDLDGVLMDSERLTHRIWAAHLQRHYGITLEPWHYLTSAGIAHLRFAEGIRYHFPQVDTGPMVEEWAEEILALARAGQVPVKPGYPEVLAAMDEKGLRRAIVTANGSEWMRCYLQTLAAEEHFELIITSDDVTETKPHPEAYLLAAKTLGVPRQACFVLEDSSVGVEAALAAGMAVGRLRDLAPVEDELLARCTAQFASLHQVAAFIRQSPLF